MYFAILDYKEYVQNNTKHRSGEINDWIFVEKYIQAEISFYSVGLFGRRSCSCFIATGDLLEQRLLQ